MSKFSDEAADYDLSLVRETAAAWMVESGDDQFWLPKSACDFGPGELKPGRVVTVTVPNWLAKEKGLL
jgi:hypothetical protein